MKSNLKIPKFADIYFFKVNSRNTRTRCEISSKLTISGFIVNFEDISHLILVFLLLTLKVTCHLGYCYCSVKVSRVAPLSFTNYNGVFWSRMFQNNRNTRARCQTSSKLTISVLILNFEHISHLVQLIALSTLNDETLARLLLLQYQGRQNSTNHNSVLQSRMFQNNRNTRTLSEISSKLTISVFIVNFERILHLVIVLVLLRLNCQILPGILLLQPQGR